MSFRFYARMSLIASAKRMSHTHLQIPADNYGGHKQRGRSYRIFMSYLKRRGDMRAASKMLSQKGSLLTTRRTLAGSAIEVEFRLYPSSAGVLSIYERL